MSGCIPIEGGYVCGVGPRPACRRILACPTEGRRRRMVVVFGGAYYSDSITCLSCGDSWSDGERRSRPFARGWRARSVAKARRNWGRALPPAEWRAAVQAEMTAVVAS